MSLRTALITGASVVALAGGAWGVRSAMRSPMFIIQVVEIVDLPEAAPVDAPTLTQLAAVPVGHTNLFDLELGQVEQRLLTHPWIREVRIEKHFPQTLAIKPVFREPQALMQAESGQLSYVDIDGRRFGQVNLAVSSDLPLLTTSCAGHVLEALQVVRAWGQTSLGKAALLAQVQWDSERGFRALVSYALEAPAASGSRGRTFVDLGQDLDAEAVRAQFERLSRVFQYLSNNRVLARQIWADAEKKIVVRTAHGS